MARSLPPVPTLGQLHREPRWLWVHCANWQCRHSAPMALAPLIIRWGPDTSSDMLRRSARCSRCGHKGATLQTPSWGSAAFGYKAFPVEPATDGVNGLVSARQFDPDEGRGADGNSAGAPWASGFAYRRN